MEWLDPIGPPLLRIIGNVDVEGTSRPLSDQQVALLAFLHSCGPVSRPAVVQAIWDGERISNQRVANLLAEIRSKIGRQHLPDPIGGLYHLRSIETDLDRFEAIVGSFANHDDQTSTEAGLCRLKDACKLIRGAPYSGGQAKHWAWLDERPNLITNVESVIADGANRLASIAYEGGDVPSAVAVLEASLLACPFDEALTSMLVELYIRQRRPGTARRQVEAWERRVRRLGCGEPSQGPRERLLHAAQAVAIGSAVTTRLPR